MKYTKNATAVVAVLGMGFSLQAYATNGMNPEGTGVKNRGMGGAGVAMANDTASITNNPAAVTDVGKRMDVAIGLFSPSPRGYTLTGNVAGLSTTQESESDLFVIPFFGISFPIDNKSAWSFVINANGGMNTNYSRNAFPTFPPNATEGTGINLEQLFVTASYGYKVTPDVSLGITGIYAYQKFRATGLQAFDFAVYTSNVGSITSNGDDTSTGFGYKIGIQANLGGNITMGASYQPKINMNTFDKYKGLFADQGDLDIAPTTAIGLAWKPNSNLTFALDYLNIDYDAVPGIGNSTNIFSPGVVRFGDSNGPGFGWKSIDVIKLGVEYAASSDWTWRAGWNHGDNPIESGEVTVNFLAPGIIEDHLTLGFTHKLDTDSELSANFVHSFKNSISGTFAPTVAGFGGGTMTLEMEQNFVEMGYSKLF